MFRCAVFMMVSGLAGHIGLWAIIWIARLSELTKSRKMGKLNLHRFVAWRQAMQTGSKPFILTGPTSFSAGLLEASSPTSSPLSFSRRGCVVQRLVLLDAAFSANKVTQPNNTQEIKL